MTFGARLRLQRKRLNLTQEQFAQIGGVKRVSQHLYEQDVRVPDLHYLMSLSEHGVDIGLLIFGEPTNRSHRADTLSVSMAIAAFRAVEEFSRNSDEGSLTMSERERFFTFLCTTLSAGNTLEDPSELKAYLANVLKR